MSLPTERQLHDLFTTLRAFAAPTGTPPSSRLDDLERRLLAASKRDSTGTTDVDGYPTNTMPTGRGQTPTPVDPDDPSAGVITLTAVEAAGIRNAEADKIREHTWHAVTFLVEAAGNLGALAHRLDLIDKLSTPTPANETAGTGYCQACGRHCSGSGEDRLRSGYCPADFKAWCRDGRKDRSTFQRERRVPT